MAEMDHEKRNRLERVWKYPRPMLFDNSGEDPKSVTPEVIYQRWCTDWRGIQKLFLAFIRDPKNQTAAIGISCLKPRAEIPENWPLEIGCAVEIRKDLIWNMKKFSFYHPDREIWYEALKSWATPYDFEYILYADLPKESEEYKQELDRIRGLENAGTLSREKREFLHRIQFGYKKPFEG